MCCRSNINDALSARNYLKDAPCDSEAQAHALNDERHRRIHHNASHRPRTDIVKAAADGAHEAAMRIIAHAFDPAYEPPTRLDLSQLPPEELRITPEDRAELERLSEPVREKLKALLHVA